ncbi:BlaI/MecI/CopY family transcriptional regulator [Enemella sp. A6]|uniref:BlaI/MecI/CopY family transcriptional regulator n=1 Tax=Enemella sp. A6 TaxID=3440152 RepID=UPI003EBF9A46
MPTALGDLELRVMEALWAQDEPVSVRAVHADITTERDLAYTTILTVLDRLAKKGRVKRKRSGRAWLYYPAASRAVMVADTMMEELADAGGDRAVALAEFADRLGKADLLALAPAIDRAMHSSAPRTA